MITKITSFVFRWIAAFALLGGFWNLFRAVNHGFDLSSASAIQVTQVYTELTFLSVTAGVLFLLTFLLEYLAREANHPSDNAQADVVAGLEQSNYLLKLIGRILRDK